MLKPEQAKETLEKLETKDWVEQHVARLGKLPDKLRRTGRCLFGYDDKGAKFEDSDAGSAAYEKIGPDLDAMAVKERLEFFEALFPGNAKHVEAAWQLLKRLPYENEYDRKCFRAPRSEEITRQARVNWLQTVSKTFGAYRQPIAWYAAWAPHLAQYGEADELGVLFAAVIDAGGKEGDEVFQILCASGRGEHEVGAMGRHVTRGLLCASRPEGWEFIEKMLLAAQREEGLRQTILETVDESHPEAFRRMLKLILDNNLVRFSAIVRALDVWLGYQWDSVSTGVVNKVIEKLLLFLDDPAARKAALGGKDPEQAYLALWTIAAEDAFAAIAPAAELLKHKKAEHRYVAAHFLVQLRLVDAQKKLLEVLADENLGVVTCALAAFEYNVDDAIAKLDLFERLEKLLPRFPRKKTKQLAMIWPWPPPPADQQKVAGLLAPSLGERAPQRLIPYLGQMEASDRSVVARKLCEAKKWDAATRDVLFSLVGDASSGVRESALEGLANCKVDPKEAENMEKLLTRVSGDLRRGVLMLLLKQEDKPALASADRLLDGASPQRVAGLELLRQLAENNRATDECRKRAEAYRKSHPKLSQAERPHIEAVLADRRTIASLDDALGLIQHADRTWPPKPVARKVKLASVTPPKVLSALDELVHAHREESVTFPDYNGDEQTLLLGAAYLPHPLHGATSEEAAKRLPLLELWEQWWAKRGPELRDEDGLELLRTHALLKSEYLGEYGDGRVILKRARGAVESLLGKPKIPTFKYAHQVGAVMVWLLKLHPPAKAVDSLLDAVETSFAAVPESELAHVVDEDDYEDADWRDDNSPFLVWLNLARSCRKLWPALWTDVHHARLWNLARWKDEPYGPPQSTADPKRPKVPRQRAELEEVLAAHRMGAATDADVIDHLIGARPVDDYGWHNDMETLTTPHEAAKLKPGPTVEKLVDRCRDRVLEIELIRGDTPTVVSKTAVNVGSVWGIDNLVAILRALGSRNFTRGWSRDSQSKETVLSHLARRTHPRDETADDFKAKVKLAEISEQRLVELAMYAPQWAPHVEHALGWKGFEDGVWWLHAHTKGADWSVDEATVEAWKAKVNERTPLTGQDLLDGAVDVAWFHRVYADLKEKWSKLDEAAKYTSGAAGHARARLFADAMLGRVAKKELATRITQKRNQDAARALGLLPLATGKAREADLLDRYKVLQEFVRTSRQFGSQRQASEKRAAQIGQENLARTAGFPDPIRLQWAMEAKEIEDLAKGPVQVKAGDVTVTLSIDAFGVPDLTVTKGAKTLADVPPALKKNPKVAEIRERKTELKRQVSRMRYGLEQLMCRGETFTGSELLDLMKHPLLAPMLQNLVLVGDGILGYPTNQGKTLEDHAGKTEALKKDETLRVAHPHDLLPADKWHQWQRDCFARERIQPFKQVFREYYPLTKTEIAEGTQSRRYAGHQVQPRKAIALLGARGWVNHPEEGVRRTFHEEGLSAWIEFQESYFTPAEVEGLTLESVHFTKRKDGTALKLQEISPRLFSEVMRDLDLVVSVAHRGGVDPEASASTVEMRSALLRDTLALLKISNVRVKENHALIEGKLGEYSVHLGSAVAHRMPGAALLLVAVHGQHRGRLFLPFADDDPKTAEVLSKVLLLARDSEIKDPNILDQIRGG